MIIDFHTHLGDILYPGGGRVVYQDIKMPCGADPDGINRALCYNNGFIEKAICSIPLLKACMMRAERARNFAATYRNLKNEMKKYGVTKACVMPVAPNVAFEDLVPVSRDDSIIPFGSIDFSKGNEGGQVLEQLKSGAKGFKLHPILQKADPAGEPVHRFLDACPAGTVILIHSGYAGYYFGQELLRQSAEFGDIEPIINLCAEYGRLKFVLGHAGLSQAGDVLRLAPRYDNVFVDTSFQGPDRIRELVNALGCERVLFASDWPWGFVKTALRCAERGCGNPREYERITGLNAAGLLS